MKEDYKSSFDIIPISDPQKILELLGSNGNAIITQILRDMNDVVPTVISMQMVGDIVRCLTTGSSEFNKLWLIGGKVIGFLVCDETHTSHGSELYIKYFGVKKIEDRKAPTELITGNIEKLIKKAKKKGFKRISLHGFNKAINWLLERRYGFKPETAKDLWIPVSGDDLRIVPYLYLDLTNLDNPIQNNDLNQLSSGQEKFTHINNQQELQSLLAERGINVNDAEYEVVKNKVIRYLRLANRDIPPYGWQSLADAIVENYNLLFNTDMGIAAAIEHHRKGTQQANKKLREELSANPVSQPELLTSYGDLRLFRLNNRQQLEIESQHMQHCVGTSEHYIKKIIDGSAEIWSVRTNTGGPLLTIEFEPNSNTARQMKKKDDELLTGKEPWFTDFLGILKQLSSLDPKVNIMSFYDIGDILIKQNEVITYDGKKTIDEFLNGEDKTVLIGKVVCNEYTQVETLITLAKVTGLTLDCTLLTPQMKNILTDVKGNLIDTSLESSQYINLTSVTGFLELRSAGSIKLPQLQSIGGYFAVNSATNINLPQLRSVGGYFTADSVTSIELPQLQSIYRFFSVNSVTNINLPQLRSVGGYFTADSVTSIELPQLQSIGGFFTVNSATNINLPQLQSIGNSFFANLATTFYLPELQLIGGYFEADSATLISLPKLQSINATFYAPTSCIIIFPKTFRINGKTKWLSFFKFSRSIARIMGFRY